MPSTTITPRDAEWRLKRLQRCKAIQPFQAGDEDLVCSNDGFHIIRSGNAYRHSADEIKAMVDAAAPLYWPTLREESDYDVEPPRMPRR